MTWVARLNGRYHPPASRTRADRPPTSRSFGRFAQQDHRSFGKDASGPTIRISPSTGVVNLNNLVKSSRSNVIQAWSRSAAEDIGRAEQLHLDIFEQDTGSSLAHSTMGMVRRFQNRLIESRFEFETATCARPQRYLRPHSARLGVAIPRRSRRRSSPVREGIQLSPRDPQLWGYHLPLGWCRLLCNGVDPAIDARVMLQVTTVAQAVQAAGRAVDVIIAQGGESGGYCGEVSTMALVPQVVDAVSPIPVVASGGIFDGRGIAAALMLGAVGVNLGTRFIASREAPGSEEWKQAILHANSEDSIKVEVLNDISPVPGAVGFGTVLRSLRTPFLDEWSGKREEARRDHLREEILATHQAGRPHETLLTAGQTAGGVKEILPLAEIMRRLVTETEAALSRAGASP
jgi:hypothetical protein